MKITRQRRPPVGIDMSPLIDCVFQLLIFFLLSSSFLTPMIRLTLPSAKTTDDPDAQEIVLSVNPEGQFFVNTKPVAGDELVAALTPLLERSKHKVVTFRGDEKTPFELFMKAIDAARQSGARNVNLAHRGGA